MYRNNSHRSARRRPGVQHFGPNQNNRRAQGRKNKKQAIDPARFVKVAEPQAVAGYEAEHQFEDFAMHPLLKSNVWSKGYRTPSEIQDKSIPLGLEGKSVIGVANTGTGKTAAFALPILNNLMRHPGSRALIIAPTRELATQIADQCRALARNSNINDALLIGGMPFGRQNTSLKRNPDIVIGTPGRIKDHLKQGSLHLGGCGMVVLDEVDRMLDMGFINDMKFILDKLPQQHQSFFFSATLSPEIRNLIDNFVSDPVTVNVKVGETSQNVHQNVMRYSGKTQKLENLHNILIKPGMNKVIIFGETKYGVDRLGKELVNRGFKAGSLHGGKTQGQRGRTLNSFRENQINILVATDVAARGIDVKDITHVINYDIPQTYDDYVHRIGRAGRAKNPGYAITFVENVS